MVKRKKNHNLYRFYKKTLGGGQEIHTNFFFDVPTLHTFIHSFDI